jgi:hypothetical protein
VVQISDTACDFSTCDRRPATGIDRLAQIGNGATGQRTCAKTGQLLDVVVEAVRRTAGR